jgi:hypothetical protein
MNPRSELKPELQSMSTPPPAPARATRRLSSGFDTGRRRGSRAMNDPFTAADRIESRTASAAPPLPSGFRLVCRCGLAAYADED